MKNLILLIIIVNICLLLSTNVFAKTQYVTLNRYEVNNNKSLNKYVSIKDIIKIVMEKPKNTILLDVRSYDEFIGNKLISGALRKRRIPGSILFNMSEYLLDNKLKDIINTKFELLKIGVTSNKNIIIYCHSGLRAENAYSIFKNVLNYNNVKVYKGSWVEWSKNNKLPIEIGEKYKDN